MAEGENTPTARTEREARLRSRPEPWGTEHDLLLREAREASERGDDGTAGHAWARWTEALLLPTPKFRVGWADVVVRGFARDKWNQFAGSPGVIQGVVSGAAMHLVRRARAGRLDEAEHPRALAKTILLRKASDLFAREVRHRGNEPAAPEEDGDGPGFQEPTDDGGPGEADEEAARAAHAAHVRERTASLIDNRRSRLGYVLRFEPALFDQRMLEGVVDVPKPNRDRLSEVVAARTEQERAHQEVDLAAFKDEVAKLLGLNHTNTLEAWYSRGREALLGAAAREDIARVLVDDPGRFRGSGLEQATLAYKAGDRAERDAVAKELTGLARAHAAGEIDADPYREHLARLLFTKYAEEGWAKTRQKAKREAARLALEEALTSARDRHDRSEEARRGGNR